MNQNGMKFVDFIHGSKFRTSSASNKFQTQASGKLRLLSPNAASDFHHFNLQHTPGAGLPPTSTLHEELFSWRSLSAGLMREWHIEKAGNEPDRAEVSNSSDLAWRGCGNVDTQALRFISARGKIQRNSKMEYGPCIWFVSVRLLLWTRLSLVHIPIWMPQLHTVHFIGYLGLDT